MARQLITLAKVIKGIDTDLDHAIDSLRAPQDLATLSNPAQSGRGLLYWTTYYDAWLMFDAFEFERFDIACDDVCDGVVSLDLQSSGWKTLPQQHFTPNQWDEEQWLLSRLREAYHSFQNENGRATLLCGRHAFGASLGDVELLGSDT